MAIKTFLSQKMGSLFYMENNKSQTRGIFKFMPSACKYPSFLRILESMGKIIVVNTMGTSGKEIGFLKLNSLFLSIVLGNPFRRKRQTATEKLNFTVSLLQMTYVHTSMSIFD